MSEKYKVNFYTGEYGTRQRAANADKVICYLEQHFNGGAETSNYTLAVVGTNAGSTSKAIAKAYVDRVSKAFGVPLANNNFARNGVSIGGYKLRGNANLTTTKMPAVLLEPLFASNPKHAAWIKSEAGQEKLAMAIVETIREFFPNGGTVGFSIGHIGKPSQPKDRGVPLYGGGTEAEYAGSVLLRAANLLVK